jgi:hypothetical protein
MAARVSALLPKVAALTLIWLLATSTITFAAGGRTTAPAAPPVTLVPEGPATLVVPDVRRQAYVFAKGLLEDGGFAWRVEGRVQGYAANTVVAQRPAPGTEVVDTGLPEVVLTLERNPDYAERGLPENASPHEGTELVRASEVAEKGPAQPAAPAEPAPEQAAEEPAPVADATQGGKSSQDGVDKGEAGREPAFPVPGAPPEPLDEMPLPQRARLVENRLAGAPRPTPGLVRFWLYQHSWLVTGAKFGWSGGAEALRIIIRVDRDLQARWGIGARSGAVARAALAEVERRSRS